MQVGRSRREPCLCTPVLLLCPTDPENAQHERREPPGKSTTCSLHAAVNSSRPLTGELVLDRAVAEGCQAADELPVVDLIVAGLVEHAKQPVQDLRVRLHDAHQLQRLPDRVLHVACTRPV